MASLIISSSGVAARRAGRMKGTTADGLARASSTRPKGLPSSSTKVRLSVACNRSVAATKNWPSGSRWLQRLRDTTQSSAVTGWPSWNFRPSRSVKLHLRPSLLLLGTKRLAVHDRHHHVEQDDTRRGRRSPQLLQSCLAVGGMERAVVHVLENFRERHARVGVVFDDEHRPAAARSRHARARATLSRPAAAGADRRGSSTTKVEPSPSLLATEILPRCASTMCRVMYRPRPMPP